VFVGGAAIIEEAGGKLTDFWGKPVNWLAKDIPLVATNGKIHDEILELIKT